MQIVFHEVKALQQLSARIIRVCLSVSAFDAKTAQLQGIFMVLGRAIVIH